MLSLDPSSGKHFRVGFQGTMAVLQALMILVFAFAACSDPTSPEFTNSHDALAPGYLPGTPTRLAVSIGLESSRLLRWDRNSVAEAGFRIERRLGSTGQYTLLGDAPSGTSSYVDTTTILTDTTYIYRISALTTTGEARGFDSTRFKHVFPTPYGLRVASEAPAYVRIAWSDTSRIATGFIVEARTRTTDFVEVARTVADSLRCTVSDLDTAEDYQFRVRGTTGLNRSTPGVPIGVFYVPVPDSQALALHLGYGETFIRNGAVNDPKSFLSPDGSLGFAVGNGPTTVLRTTSGTPVWTSSTLVISVGAFSGDNSTMALFSGDQYLRVIRLSDGATIRAYYFAPPVSLYSVCLDHDGSRVAAMSSRHIWVYDNATGSLVFGSPDHPELLSGRLVMNRDGSHLACLSGIRNVEMWDVNNSQLLSNTRNSGRSYFAVFGPKSLFANGHAAGVSFSNYLTGAMVSSTSVPMESTSGEAAFDAEGRYLYHEQYKRSTATLEGISVARASDGRILRMIPAIAGERLARHIIVTDVFGRQNTLVKVDAQNRVLIRHMTNCWIQNAW